MDSDRKGKWIKQKKMENGLPFFKSGCVGVLISSSSSGQVLKVNKK